MVLLILQWVAGLYFGIAILLMILFKRDYGRSGCWERDVGEAGEFMLIFPFLIIAFIVFVPCYLIYGGIKKIRAR